MEKGTFPEGIIHEGRLCREFTLRPETFRDSLEIYNDPELADRVKDQATFMACMFARRITIEGIDVVTPEMIENLCRADGQELLLAETRLDDRRKQFRDAAGAAPETPGGAPEAGS